MPPSTDRQQSTQNPTPYSGSPNPPPPNPSNPPRRGRRLATPSSDPRINQARLQTRIRTQQYRERLARERAAALERIVVERSATVLEEAHPTEPEVGLRINDVGVDLDQDTGRSRIDQLRALPVGDDADYAAREPSIFAQFARPSVPELPHSTSGEPTRAKESNQNNEPNRRPVVHIVFEPSNVSRTAESFSNGDNAPAYDDDDFDMPGADKESAPSSHDSDPSDTEVVEGDSRSIAARRDEVSDNTSDYPDAEEDSANSSQGPGHHDIQDSEEEDSGSVAAGGDDLERSLQGSSPRQLTPSETSSPHDRSASRRLSLSLPEVDDEALEAVHHVTAKLVEQLQEGFHGCTDEEHETIRIDHQDCVEHHTKPSRAFDLTGFPHVLSNSSFLRPQDVEEMPSAAKWQALFSGNPTREGRLRARPMHLCMHSEETQEEAADIAYDIDSFLGFATSLSVARHGLELQPAHQMKQNIQTDVHLTTSADRPNADPNAYIQTTRSMLRDVPQCLLGRFTVAPEISLHVLFPHLPYLDTNGAKFKAMTKRQLTTWTDDILLPAIGDNFKAHYTQHLPSTYQHAKGNARARQVEARLDGTRGYQTEQSITHHIQPEALHGIWQRVLGIIEDRPGLAQFRDPELFFSAKGTKLRWKSNAQRTTLLDTIEDFTSFLGKTVYMSSVDRHRFYVDIGKEICVGATGTLNPRRLGASQPQVYSWKRCCLESYIKWVYDGHPPRKDSGCERFYYQNMLRDACSMTSTPKRQSMLGRGGLVYSQFYSSVKEIWDASKCYPFQNDALEELAIDPALALGANSLHGRVIRQRKTIESAYTASKARIHTALQGSLGKSFGIREEHRVQWILLCCIARQLREEQPASTVALDDCPTYAWPVGTADYLRFVRNSVEKFAIGFEVVRARSLASRWSWENSKVLATFLRCLRFVLGAHQLRPESGLWWSCREGVVGEGHNRRRRLHYGLGFCNTLLKYGYCWWEARLDWSSLTYKSELTDQMLFGNSALKRRYHRRHGQVAGFFDLDRRLDLGLQWLDLPGQPRSRRRKILTWMAHLCLEQFRVDVLSSIQHEIFDDHRPTALRGKRGFSFEYLETILQSGVYLVSGNRGAVQHPAEMFEYLFGFDDSVSRAHWDNRAYRVLYKRVVAALAQAREGTDVHAFTRAVTAKFYDFHWILPYPSPLGLTQTTKEGTRMWFSIRRRAGSTPSEGGDTTDKLYEWGRKQWQGGDTPELPEYTRWNKQAWQRHLNIPVDDED